MAAASSIFLKPCCTSSPAVHQARRPCLSKDLFQVFPVAHRRLGIPGQLGTMGQQLLGRSFQKTGNFTAKSHQNAGFSI